MSLEYTNTYSLTQNKGIFYIFEITLYNDNDNEKKIYKKIKTLKYDSIFNIFDKIKFNFNKIKIVFIDLNNPNNIITIKKNIILEKNNKIILQKNNLFFNLGLVNKYFVCEYYFN